MAGALGAENPFPLFAVAWGIWIIYIISLRSKGKKETQYKGYPLPSNFSIILGFQFSKPESI
jgi:hypothetical protein